MSGSLLRREIGCILSSTRTGPRQRGIEVPFAVFIFRPLKERMRAFSFCFTLSWEKMLPPQFNYDSALITEEFCLDMNQTAGLE